MSPLLRESAGVCGSYARGREELRSLIGSSTKTSDGVSSSSCVITAHSPAIATKRFVGSEGYNVSKSRPIGGVIGVIR